MRDGLQEGAAVGRGLFIRRLAVLTDESVLPTVTTRHAVSFGDVFDADLETGGLRF